MRSTLLFLALLACTPALAQPLPNIQYDLFIKRGSAAYKRGDHKAAVREFTNALKFNPDGFDALINRGVVYQDVGLWQHALDDYKAAAKANPKSYGAHNNIAWLLATCPDDNIRDGTLAKLHALEACELTQWKLFATFDTLAAAYAEAGEFDKAIEYQRKCIELAPMDFRAPMRKALKLYEAGKPARLKAPVGTPMPHK